MVERPGIDPEELAIATNLRKSVGVDSFRMCQNGLQATLHRQVSRVPLHVVNIPPRNRCLIQMPDQELLLERQILEPVGVKLHDGDIIDSFQQILARVLVLLGRFVGSGRRCEEREQATGDQGGQAGHAHRGWTPSTNRTGRIPACHHTDDPGRSTHPTTVDDPLEIWHPDCNNIGRRNRAGERCETG